MAVDRAAKDWQQVAEELAPRLPGDWTATGAGIRTILVRRPIDWILVWCGADRVRKADAPHLIGGLTPLIGPFSFGLRRGSSSNQRLDFSAGTAPEMVERFVLDDILPDANGVGPELLAAEAERQLAQPDEEREPPRIFPEAACWRLILGNESPLEPADQAAAWFSQAFDPESAGWYQRLADAWRSGGPEAARGYVEARRDEVLAALALL